MNRQKLKQEWLKFFTMMCNSYILICGGKLMLDFDGYDSIKEKDMYINNE